MAIHLRQLTGKRCLHKRFSTTTNSVDTQEIEHFKKYSDKWWDPNGPLKGLHALNKLRVPFIRDCLINEGVVNENYINTASPLKGLSVLDVGCGGGILSECLYRLGANVTAIDANPSLIDTAKKRAKNKSLNINYSFTTIEEHSNEYFEVYDAVVSSEVIEHISQKKQFVRDCCKCLKPSGSIIITTMSKTYLANFLGIFVVENVIDVVPKGTHQYEKFIVPQDLQMLLKRNHVHTKVIQGLTYNFLTNNWFWWFSTSINYCLHGVKYK